MMIKITKGRYTIKWHDDDDRSFCVRLRTRHVASPLASLLYLFLLLIITIIIVTTMVIIIMMMAIIIVIMTIPNQAAIIWLQMINCTNGKCNHTKRYNVLTNMIMMMMMMKLIYDDGARYTMMMPMQGIVRNCGLMWLGSERRESSSKVNNIGPH